MIKDFKEKYKTVLEQIKIGEIKDRIKECESKRDEAFENHDLKNYLTYTHIIARLREKLNE